MPALKKQGLLFCFTLTAVVASVSGCQSDHKGGDGDSDYALGAGESWEEQREQAKSILASYTQKADHPGRLPASANAPASSSLPHGTSGPPILSAVGNPTSSRMVVTFTGARSPAAKSCGIDYSAEAVESAKAVVIVILQQHHSYGETCTMEGTDRTATLNLARPLANRTVLELPQDQPIPVSTDPVTQ